MLPCLPLLESDMTTGLVKIYYIGRRRKGKRDNVLHRRHRFWRKFGDCIEVPPEDAAVYLRYPEVWGDEKAYHKAREARKAEQAEVAKLEAELDPPAEDGKGPAKIKGEEISGDDRQVLIQSALLSLDPNDTEKDYTKGGVPRVNRVVELVGTNVTADEITEALNLLRQAGKLPAAKK